MSAWAKVEEGWALNLDGTDAATVFTLPRLEVRASRGGWFSLCFLEDGTRSERSGCPADSAPAAKAAAIAQASRVLGPSHASALRRAGRP